MVHIQLWTYFIKKLMKLYKQC